MSKCLLTLSDPHLSSSLLSRDYSCRRTPGAQITSEHLASYDRSNRGTEVSKRDEGPLRLKDICSPFYTSTLLHFIIYIVKKGSTLLAKLVSEN